MIFLYQVEVLSAKPEVVIIHEVLTDHEIQQIKLKAISKLQVHSLMTLNRTERNFRDFSDSAPFF